MRPDQFAANQELLQLSVEGERFWDEAWSKFKAGDGMGSRWTGACSPSRASSG